MDQGLSTEALRFAATLYDSDEKYRPLGEKDAVETLRKRASNAANIRKVSQWLLKVAKTCKPMRSNPRLKAVSQIVQARLLGVAIGLREDMSNKDRQDLLACWEKISFRIYGMMRKDARWEVVTYVRLAWRVVNDKQISVEEIESGIKEIGKEFPIKNALDAIRGENCYEKWQEELRYLMFRYEEYLTKQAGIHIKNEHWPKIWTASLSKSIEHITPQSEKPSGYNVHRLGNLMLLPPGLNFGLKDKPPEEKFSEYRKTGLLTAQEVVSTKGKWGLKAIEEREEKILKWAKQEWGD